MTRRTIALFGGTFDPIHLGHTAVALSAGESLLAESVIFVPAKQSPLKGFFPSAGDEDRLAMIHLAIADEPLFAVSDYELRKSTPSYTLDTVRYLQSSLGDAVSIHWLLGADSVSDLAHWHRIKELLDACNLSVMRRAGAAVPDFSLFESLWGSERVRKLRQDVIETPLVDISSSEVRRRLTAGLDVSGMLCPAVSAYIRRHGLYR